MDMHFLAIIMISDSKGQSGICFHLSQRIFHILCQGCIWNTLEPTWFISYKTCDFIFCAPV